MKILLKKKRSIGFLTFEIVLSLALITLALSATITVLASNQNLTIDIGQASVALEKAEFLLEQMKASNRKDFNLVHTSGFVQDGVFTKRTLVKTLQDFETKEVTSEVSWKSFGVFDQFMRLSMLVTNSASAGSDTCDSNLSGDWSYPAVINSTKNFATIVQDPASIFPITDMDAYFGRLVVTTNNSSTNKPTVFILDSTDPYDLKLIASIDNDSANNTGVNAVILGKVAGKTYAFVASASSFVKGQLQIIDVNPPYSIVTYKIPTTIVKGSSTQGVGNSIFYDSGYVYLGLKKTVLGPEFDIIDVRDPSNPQWVGGYTIQNGVNSIFVKDGLAYIASPNNEELIILDVTDPTNPYYVNGYDAPDSIGNGKSIYRVADTLYLGRTVTSLNPEFLLLDVANKTHIQPLASVEIGNSVNGIFIRDYLAFVLTNLQLQIYDIHDTNQIIQFSSPVALSSSGGSPAPTLECEGNYLYVGSNDTSNRGYILVVTSQ